MAIQSFPPNADVSALIADNQPPEVRAAALRHANDPALAEVLWTAAADNDAFIAQAAREGLTRSGVVCAVVDLKRLSPAQRLACLLVLREKHIADGPKLLPAFLRDPATEVRFAAIQWIAEEQLTAFRQSLADALSAGPATSRLFGGYLAALERLDGVQRSSSDEWAGEQYIVQALEDKHTTPEVRRWAFSMLRPDHPALSLDRLSAAVASDDPSLQLEAVRTLRDSKHPQRFAMLASMAKDRSRSAELRAEAIVGLSADDNGSRALLVTLATDSEHVVSDEALRSLRGSMLDDRQRQVLSSLSGSDPAQLELVQRVLEPTSPRSRPSDTDLAGWLKLLGGSDDRFAGNVSAGRRIFFHPKAAGCARCHQIEGRGATIGPELTATAGKLSRERLIESILRPAKEIAPQFATWLVIGVDGKTLTGMLVKEEATGEQTYADSNGALFRFGAHDLAARRIQPTSIMPEGLSQQLTVQEFRDLAAFLQSPRSAAVAAK